MRRLEQPQLRGTLLGRLLRAWNPFMKRLLRSRLHMPWSRWFAVIQWRGRKTGRIHSTPVSCARFDGRLLITTGDRWWRNLVGGAAVRVWFRGRRHAAVARPVLAEEDSLALHLRMFADQPLFALLAGVTDRSDREQIRRSIRAGRTLVLVELEEASG
jgi:hypothetical protein